MTGHYSPDQGEVVDTTEARQANGRKMNLRVLIFSTTIITLIFAGFVVAFMYKTPPSMDASSGGGGNAPQTNTVPSQEQTSPTGHTGPSTGAAAP